jgi:3-oxoacyl-[acyl-carrier protein] reductase
MDLGLRDRVCVITGASRGIGRATAVALAGEGAALLLVSRNEDTLREAATAAGGRAETLALDVTEADAGERVLDACRRHYGRIDALVNNAGTSAVRSLEELTDGEWQEQWELHVMAPMRLMRAAAPAMAERGWGRIVNVCSSSGKRPSSTNAAYSVTKAAELSLSRAFADKYGSEGVLVNAVAPGPIGGDLWLRTPRPRGSRARRCSRRRPSGRRWAGLGARRRSRASSPSCAPSAPQTSSAQRGPSTAAMFR